MGDIGMQLWSEQTAAVAIGVAIDAAGPGHVTIFVESHATLVAEAGAQMIFLAAAPAAVAQFSAGHGEKQPIVAFDQLDVTDDEGAIECERAVRP
jgi:hypothetical protein